MRDSGFAQRCSGLHKFLVPYLTAKPSPGIKFSQNNLPKWYDTISIITICSVGTAQRSPLGIRRLPSGSAQSLSNVGFGMRDSGYTRGCSGLQRFLLPTLNAKPSPGIKFTPNNLPKWYDTISIITICNVGTALRSPAGIRRLPNGSSLSWATSWLKVVSFGF